jgi:transmembrane sensor
MRRTASNRGQAPLTPTSRGISELGRQPYRRNFRRISVRLRMQNSRDIEAQAARWLIRLDRENSVEVRAEFQEWLASGSRNRATFVRLEKSWRRADYLKNVKPLDGEVNENVLDTFPGALSERTRRERERDSRKGLNLAIAAAAVLASLLVGLWIAVLRRETQVFKTDLGGFQRIALQDGSIALLNTNSELRVRFTRERRQIELARGEALFSVAHDTRRPFDVKAGDTVIRAVGTAFSVRLVDRKQVDVIVTEGRVAIDPPDDSLNEKLGQAFPLPNISTLTAGQTVRVTAHRLQVQKIDDDVVSRQLAWTKGRLSFDRVTLDEAVTQFNRYNRRQLVIDDPEIADLHISGAFDATDLDSFVAALSTLGIRATASHIGDEPDTGEIRLSGTSPVP